MTTTSSGSQDPPGRPASVASWWHTASVLGILAAAAIHGAMVASRAGAAGASEGPTGSFIPGYVYSIGTEIGLAYWVWVGAHWNGKGMADLTGGRWTSFGQATADFGIAIPFWVVWEFTARIVGNAVTQKVPDTYSYHVPSGAAEVFLWILVSISAGFCEELLFRGYLQRQFHSATGSVVVAVLLQGVIFGLLHSYKGWSQVITITALGILYGALVAWRRNLRASMIAHAWSDIYEGYVKFFWLGRP
jgi:membrane protease YdiL (CAAX protease family)